MAKVVYNKSYGGYFLSGAALALYEARTGVKVDTWRDVIPRHDPALVQIVEELGPSVAGSPDLAIFEIPDGGRYRITEYDGWETVEQPEDIEWVIAGSSDEEATP